MTTAKALFWGWIITVVLTLSVATPLYIWTVKTIDKQLPGWMSAQVLANRLSIMKNEKNNLQNTYLIAMEGEIRNIRLGMTRKDMERAAKRLERVIQKAIGGR